MFMMQTLTTNLQIEYTAEYFFSLSLVGAALVNIVLAFMLLFDSNNYLYTETPRYLRARRLTGASLMVFAAGFLLHWWFMPHFTNLLLGKALSFSYFHIGGVLFSMSHTGLIDRHYFTRQVIVRDVTVLTVSLCIYWANAFIGNTTLTYIGSALFFLHIGYLTWVFYSHFLRIYRQLGHYADYLPNDTDHEVLWLHYSCHLIIAFGIGGMLCTVVFHDATLPFTILLLLGTAIFSYIYKALDSFGFIAIEAEGNLRESEEYVNNDESDTTPTMVDVSEYVKEQIEQWVEERHYTDARLNLNDTLVQLGITEKALNHYLVNNTDSQNYRQWIVQLRIEEAKRQILLHPKYTLQSIALVCGYSAGSSLTRAFKTQEGMTPAEWQKKQCSPDTETTNSIDIIDPSIHQNIEISKK